MLSPFPHLQTPPTQSMLGDRRTTCPLRWFIEELKKEDLHKHASLQNRDSKTDKTSETFCNWGRENTSLMDKIHMVSNFIIYVCIFFCAYFSQMS